MTAENMSDRDVWRLARQRAIAGIGRGWNLIVLTAVIVAMLAVALFWAAHDASDAHAEAHRELVTALAASQHAERRAIAVARASAEAASRRAIAASDRRWCRVLGLIDMADRHQAVTRTGRALFRDFRRLHAEFGCGTDHRRKR